MTLGVWLPLSGTTSSSEQWGKLDQKASRGFQPREARAHGGPHAPVLRWREARSGTMCARRFVGTRMSICAPACAVVSMCARGCGGIKAGWQGGTGRVLAALGAGRGPQNVNRGGGGASRSLTE